MDENPDPELQIGLIAGPDGADGVEFSLRDGVPAVIGARDLDKLIRALVQTRARMTPPLAEGGSPPAPDAAHPATCCEVVLEDSGGIAVLQFVPGLGWVAGRLGSAERERVLRRIAGATPGIGSAARH